MNAPIVIHIGAHRCGSTALQSALRMARDTEAVPNGDIVIKTEIDRHPQLRALRRLSTAHRFDLKYQRQLHALGRWLQAQRGPLIISDENLLGPMTGIQGSRHYPNLTKVFRGLARLTPALGKRLRIVVLARPVDRLIESIYAFRVLRGETQSFRAFVDSLKLDDFRWSRFQTAAQATNLLQNLHLLPIEDFTDAIASALFSVPVPLSQVPRTVNGSLPPQRLNLLRALHQAKIGLPTSDSEPMRKLVHYLLSADQIAQETLDEHLAPLNMSLNDSIFTQVSTSAQEAETPLFSEAERENLHHRFADELRSATSLPFLTAGSTPPGR